jgi:hypothetical protein
MATPYRSTCTVDGTSFDCVSVSVALQTAKDQNSMPLMTSMKVSIDCLVDFHDDNNVPYSTLTQVFALAQKPKTGNYVPIKIVFWKDEEKQDALCSYTFQGWVSNFHTFNPAQQTSVPNGFNHMWLLTLQPALNTQNYAQLSMSN